MRTAVDSNILLDVLLPDPVHQERSVAALESAAGEGSLVVCEVVVAEVGGQFDRADEAIEVFTELALQLLPTNMVAAHAAGRLWREYRRRGGRRDRVGADFLIGAHALHQADRLLTRDRGYYRSYFPKLRIETP
jgi:predicted nucleic acid-binding protein